MGKWENHRKNHRKMVIYPLVMTNIAIEYGIFTLGFPIKHGVVP